MLLGLMLASIVKTRLNDCVVDFMSLMLNKIDSTSRTGHLGLPCTAIGQGGGGGGKTLQTWI